MEANSTDLPAADNVQRNVKNTEEDVHNDDSKDSFNAKIIKQTENSVTIDWRLIPLAEVYGVEKYHRRRGWEQVVWTSQSPAVVANLEDNFAYRLRIRALKYSAETKAYEQFAVSQDIVAKTLSAPPSNLSLQRAIKKGKPFLVKSILRRRASLIECPAPNGYLPLANAIICGELCIIDVLLMAGASVHVGNPQNGRTPLHLAFYYGRLPVARMLLNKRAALNAADVNGMTACHFAVDANQCEILRFALENGADLEASDACGWTLLLRAVVMRAELSILKLLLVHGANTQAVDRLGQSCVDLARLYANEKAAKYFAHSLKIKEKQ